MKGYYLMPHPPIMIPEIGCGKEKEIINTINACNKIGEEIFKKDIDTIVIITPHGNVFRDGVCIAYEDRIKGDLGKFGAFDVAYDLEINKNLTRKIIDNCNESNIPVIELTKDREELYNIKLELDHGALVPLYYVLKEKEYRIVHITYGMLTPLELYKFGMQIKKSIDENNERAVIIASGDLSHKLKEGGPYEYSEYAKKFDNSLLNILEKGNVSELFNMDENLIMEASECGLRSVYILMGTLDEKEIKGDILSYEGPFGVGYAAIRFNTSNSESLYNTLIWNKEEEHRNKLKEGNPYTKLARSNLDNYFKSGISLRVSDIKDEKLLKERRGVFVSLKIKGILRGCIGTITPTTECIGVEIIKNSLSAAFNDPRFPRLREEELLECSISVDILDKAEKCNLEDLNPENYGVIVSSQGKRGLLLPNLEGIDDAKTQVEIAMEKGNISPFEDYELERFKVTRYKEGDE
ncbi:MAG: AmmeMemoRadiSam system protein A [Terrisporobacter sp.]